MSLTSSSATLTQGGFTTLTAVLSDTTGLSSITGGTLTNAAGTVTYGSFASSGTPGQFALTLTWTAINGAQPITFVGASTLTATATFTDSALQHATRTVDIGLVCGNGASPNGACSGTCVDLSTADNCGTCGASCIDGTAGSATATCTAPGVCGITTSINVGVAPSGSLTSSTVFTNTPSLSCATACTQVLSTSSCTAASATLVDGTTTPMGCTQSGRTFPVAKMISTSANNVQCFCDVLGNAEAIAGSSNCTASCGGEGCITLGIAPNSDAFYSIADACDAPQIYVDWAAFDGGASVELNDAPLTIACNCQGSAVH